MTRTHKIKITTIVSVLIIAITALFFTQHFFRNEKWRWHYQLNGLSQNFIADHSGDVRTVFVVPSAFSREDVARLRNGGSNLIFAYLDLGAAEGENAYTNEEWVRTIYKSGKSLLEKIIASGFDGAFLDHVDAYAALGKTDAYAALKMVDLVIAMKKRAKLTKPDFKFVIQNGACIWKKENFKVLRQRPYGEKIESFMNALDGIALEKPFSSTDKSEVECLSEFKKTGKTVFGIEYLESRSESKKAFLELEKNGIRGASTDPERSGKWYFYGEFPKVF